MSDLLTRAAALLARSLPGLLPAEKAEWGRAMRREIDEMDRPGEAFLFAASCVWGAVKERVRPMETMIKLGRMLIPAAMLVLGVVTSLSARRLMPIDEAVGMSFILVAAAFLLGGLLTILRGPHGLIASASAMLGLQLLVSAWTLAAPASFPGGPLAPIQRALLVEGLVIWTVLLGAGLLLAASAPHSAGSTRGRD